MYWHTAMKYLIQRTMQILHPRIPRVPRIPCKPGISPGKIPLHLRRLYIYRNISKGFVLKEFKMNKEALFLVLVLAALTYGKSILSDASPSFDSKFGASSIPNETWNYVTVRKNAHVFYWFYGAQSNRRDQLPLVLWLQGGPGASGTGFGNFEEIGPLYQNKTPRSTTWIKKTNLLFVDSPVGAGFSYVDSNAALTDNVTQIADDLLEVLKDFLRKLTIFEDSPFYIFGESYGGKMAAVFGQRLQETIERKEIKCNFKGVALGDSLISPVDSILSWGKYLKELSLLDIQDFRDVQNSAGLSVNYFNQELYQKSTEYWSKTRQLISVYTDKVNMYNVLQHNTSPYSYSKDILNRLYDSYVAVYYQKKLKDFMNTDIRKKLNSPKKIIPSNVTWGGQAVDVFTHQSEDFMRPAIKAVDYLIAGGLKVDVYQGQLDIICNTGGAEKWIGKLKWSGLPGFDVATRKPLYVDGQIGQTQAFVKSFGNFSLYYILNAGLMVPIDNGAMALKMLEKIISTA